MSKTHVLTLNDGLDAKVLKICKELNLSVQEYLRYLITKDIETRNLDF